MANPMERRVYSRMAFSKPISFELSTIEAGDLGKALFTGSSVDISLGGMGLLTSRHLRAGEIMKLLMPMEEVKIVVPVMAEVKWCRPFENEYRSGLTFLS
jgi:hypothetical protein